MIVDIYCSQLLYSYWQYMVLSKHELAHVPTLIPAQDLALAGARRYVGKRAPKCSLLFRLPPQAWEKGQVIVLRSLSQAWERAGVRVGTVGKPMPLDARRS